MERNGLEQKRHATIRNLETLNNVPDRDFDRRHNHTIDRTVKRLIFIAIVDILYHLQKIGDYLIPCDPPYLLNLLTIISRWMFEL